MFFKISNCQFFFSNSDFDFCCMSNALFVSFHHLPIILSP